MSIDDVPTGKTGGQSGVLGSAASDLPEKLRVHALARLVGRTSKQVLAALTDLGQEVRSVQSSVTRATAEQVIAAFAPAEDAPTGDSPGVGEQPASPAAATAERAVESAVEPIVELSPESAAEPAPRAVVDPDADTTPDPVLVLDDTSAERPTGGRSRAKLAPVFTAAPMFQPPAPVPAGQAAPASTDSDATDGSAAGDADEKSGGRAKPSGKAGRGRRGRRKDSDAAEDTEAAPADAEEQTTDETSDEAGDDGPDSDDTDENGTRRRRRRGRRGRGRGRGADEDGEFDEGSDDESSAAGSSDADSSDGAEGSSGSDSDDSDGSEDSDDAENDGGGSRRRRRRRRRGGSDNSDDREDDPPNTVTKVRQPREKERDRESDSSEDQVQSVRGSTRLEAKRQRRRDGRDAGRRRPPILSESEFLARRESVDRSMVIRQLADRTEIGVLEDEVLVEHFITGGKAGDASMVGNVYLGRVQNVLPSMEAAFVDIGRGRNAVLYAGEVNWDAAGLNGKARKIEQALSSGDQILVQVTKDPVGHKGARLTSQISLAGRFLVYVPSGSAAGISRKLPDTERKRLKDMLKEIVPAEAGVIIRTASEGVSHEALERDVRRLQAQWEVVKEKSEKTGKGAPKAPTLLYEEPDMLVKVVRDQFNEDFSRLIISGDDAWDTVAGYVQHVAPELSDRIHRHTGPSDVFTDNRIDEQLLKALDRKVWLPSGGTLVIDRTEAMTVVDVNTGKFTGSGGNLEETVTRNNLEAAEEVVRQMRLRDIGGIIVVDFIDMVLEANRDLVLRRLTECLARDRTRHQVAEVTSLGLVQMTRKRVGGGLLEHFSTPCEHCRGRGVVISTDGSTHDHQQNGNGQQGQNGNGQNGNGQNGNGNGQNGNGQNGEGGGRRSRRSRRGGSDRGPSTDVDTSSAVAGVALIEAASRAPRAQDDDTAPVTGAVPAGAGYTEPQAGDVVPDVDTAIAPSADGAEVSAVTPAVTAVPEKPDAAEQAPVTGRVPGRTVVDPAPAPEPSGPAQPAALVDEPVAAGSAPAGIPESRPNEIPQPDEEAGRPRRRRGKVVRSAGAPDTAPEPVVITTAAAPEPEPAGGTEAATTAVVPQPEPVPATTRPRRRRAASRPAGPPVDGPSEGGESTP